MLSCLHYAVFLFTYYKTDNLSNLNDLSVDRKDSRCSHSTSCKVNLKPLKGIRIFKVSLSYVAVSGFYVSTSTCLSKIITQGLATS